MDKKLLNEFIRKTKGKEEYCVFSHQTNKNFGCYPSKAKANKRLGQIKMFSKMKESIDKLFAEMSSVTPNYGPDALERGGDDQRLSRQMLLFIDGKRKNGAVKDEIIDDLKNLYSLTGEQAENYLNMYLDWKASKMESKLNEATDYPFLNHIKDPMRLHSDGESELINLPLFCVGSLQLYGAESEPLFDIRIDSRAKIQESMEKSDTLTEEIEEEFERDYISGSWSNWIKGWVTRKGGEVEHSGNTYNEDSAHYWGDIFEYTAFKDLDGHDGAIIMWHHGGDVRGNYGLPEVWFGDFEEFFSAQYFSESSEEIAYMLGYEGDFSKLEDDIKRWKNDEEYIPSQKDKEDMGQERLPGMESKQEVTDLNVRDRYSELGLAEPYTFAYEAAPSETGVTVKHRLRKGPMGIVKNIIGKSAVVAWDDGTKGTYPLSVLTTESKVEDKKVDEITGTGMVGTYSKPFAFSSADIDDLAKEMKKKKAKKESANYDQEGNMNGEDRSRGSAFASGPGSNVGTSDDRTASIDKIFQYAAPYLVKAES